MARAHRRLTILYRSSLPQAKNHRPLASPLSVGSRAVLASSYRKVVVLGLLLALLNALLFVDVPASGVTLRDEDTRPRELPDPTLLDAPALSSELGISIEEAVEVLQRQPLVGQMEGALRERKSRLFGGLFIDYLPQYRVTVLTSPGQSSLVMNALHELDFSDLAQFVAVKETSYTEDVLLSAMAELKALARSKLTSLDLDIRTGEVLATAETESDVGAVRTIVDSSDLPVPSDRVSIRKETVHYQHSYGGLALNSPNGGPCTSGFSVRRTTDGDHGVASAAHCPNSGVKIAHLSGTTLDFVDGKWNGNQDVQWFRTPGMEDSPQIKVLESGTTRNVNSRKDRSEMSVDSMVCHFGRSTGYGCGFIDSKTYDPMYPGHPTNSTFIRVRSDDTMTGDSGGPWFLNNAAYGIHSGSTRFSDEPFFMAQNYMDALNLVVRIG